MSETSPFGSDLEARIAYLRESCEAHTELWKKLAEADQGRIFEGDLISFAALNRSLSLIEGFTALIRAGNILCAGALLRLQLDSAMRLNACRLVDEPQTVAEALLRGRPLSEIKSRTGVKLTDLYLRKELAKAFSWVEPVYKATSGFVHLSSPHMLSMVSNIDAASRKASFRLGPMAREATEGALLEAVSAFIEATDCLLRLVSSWLVTKENVALARQKEKRET